MQQSLNVILVLFCHYNSSASRSEYVVRRVMPSEGGGVWWGGVKKVSSDSGREDEEDFNSMIQQRYQFPQMAGRLLLTYIGRG